MTKLEAWYRRNFCYCIRYYGKEKLKIGEVYYGLNNGGKYIYVGKNKLWISLPK